MDKYSKSPGIRRVFLFLLMVGMVSIMYAQNQPVLPSFVGKTVNLRTSNNLFLTGDVTEENDSLIVLKRSSGTVTIPRKEIRYVTIVSTVSNASSPAGRPLSTRSTKIPASDNPQLALFSNRENIRGLSEYFVGSSAIGLKKGKAYYRITDLYIQSISVGLTDNLTIRVSALLVLPAFGSISYTFPFNDDVLHMGAGYMVVAPYLVNKELHVFYFTQTYGNARNNITLNFGGYPDYFYELPYYSLAGRLELTPVDAQTSVVVIGEYCNLDMTTLGSSFSGYATGGLRMILNKMSLDLGLIGFKDNRNNFAFGPVISVNLLLSTKK